MLTKTSISAIRLLIYLGRDESRSPASLREAAAQLSASPTYLAKVARELVKSGILRAQRGVSGGVSLNLPPKAITLQAIVESCQGTLLGDFCHGNANPHETCAFHQASVELHRAICGVLGTWTLADLLRKPGPSQVNLQGHGCWIQIGVPARSSASASGREVGRHA